MSRPGNRMESQRSDAGIVVLGAPRSGTTLVRRLLAAHPEIACPAETYLFGAAARFLHEEPFGDGLATGVVPGLRYAGIGSEAVLDALRGLVFGFLDRIRQQQGRSRWAEKTAFDSFHADAVERLCGDRVHYLCVFRSGLDVACSIAELVDKMGVYPSELHRYVREHAAPLDAFAHAWVDVCGALLELCERRPGRCVSLRYEDLLADPGVELDRAFRALGCETDVEALLERAFVSGDSRPGLGDWKTYQLSQLSTASVGRFQQLPLVRQRRLAEICGPTLERLGYPVPELAAPPDPEEAERRMQLSLMVARMKAGATPRSGDG